MYNYPIVRFMGFGIVILAGLEISGITDFSPIYLLGLSISALALTILDLLELKGDEKDDPFSYRKLKLTVLFMAMLFFIVVPNLSVNFSQEIIEKINNILVLLSVGFLFIILGYKQENIMNEKTKKIIEGMVSQMLEENVNQMAIKSINQFLDKDNLEVEVKKALSQIAKESHDK